MFLYCRKKSGNTRASLVAQRLKCLPGMLETWVRSLGREDPLEKEMATHFSTVAWRIPWREEPGGLQFMGWQRVGHDWATSLAVEKTVLIQQGETEADPQSQSRSRQRRCGHRAAKGATVSAGYCHGGVHPWYCQIFWTERSEKLKDFMWNFSV